MPFYLKHIKNKTTREDTAAAGREELNVISNIGVSIRAMVSGAEALTR